MNTLRPQWTPAEEARLEQMRASGGLTARQIAERLGRPVESVRSRLRRAKARREINPHGEAKNDAPAA